MEFPILSSGGDHTQIPHTLGTMILRTPETPDLAGKPTEKACHLMHNVTNIAIVNGSA